MRSKRAGGAGTGLTFRSVTKNDRGIPNWLAYYPSGSVAVVISNPTSIGSSMPALTASIRRCRLWSPGPPFGQRLGFETVEQRRLVLIDLGFNSCQKLMVGF